MFISEDKKKAILTDYANPEIKAKDIEKKYGVNASTIVNLVIESGGQPRRNRRKTVKCHNCHRMIEGKGFKFCPYCGTDIRTEKDLILEKTRKLYTYLEYLPQNVRDEVRELILETESYIRKEK